jgi:hypothetical protein
LTPLCLVAARQAGSCESAVKPAQSKEGQKKSRPERLGRLQY